MTLMKLELQLTVIILKKLSEHLCFSPAINSQQHTIQKKTLMAPYYGGIFLPSIVDMSDFYVDLSDLYVDLSVINVDFIRKKIISTCSLISCFYSVLFFWEVNIMIWQVDIITLSRLFKNYVDLSDVMSTCQITMSTCQIMMTTCWLVR